jgi:hypothetical protein
MQARPEDITWRTFLGWLVLAILFALPATAIAIWVGPGGQPLVARLAAAAFCAIVVWRLIIVIRAHALIGQTTAAEIAMQPHRPRIQIDPLLVQLADEVGTVLPWRRVPPVVLKRLLLLCDSHGVSPPRELLAESGGHVTWQELEAILSHIEQAA